MRVIIDVAFEGHPEGKDADGKDAPSVHYKPGDVADVPDEFAQNILGKKLAHLASDEAAVAIEAAPAHEEVAHEAE